MTAQNRQQYKIHKKGRWQSILENSQSCLTPDLLLCQGPLFLQLCLRHPPPQSRSCSSPCLSKASSPQPLTLLITTIAISLNFLFLSTAAYFDIPFLPPASETQLGLSFGGVLCISCSTQHNTTCIAGSQ